MARNNKTNQHAMDDWVISPTTELDIVATREGFEPVIKKMTYKEWIEFKIPKNGWNYTAYQKDFHSFSYINKND